MALPSLTSFTIEKFEQEEYEGSGLRIKGLHRTDPAVGIVMGGEPSDLLLQRSSGILGVIETPDGYSLVPKSSSIKHLDFVRGDVSCRFLADILTLPAALEHFRYEFGKYPEGIMPFIPSRFLPALLTQAESLKVIEITTHPHYIRNENHLIGSFANLHALERLIIPLSVLLNYGDAGSAAPAAQNPLDALLPPSLVHLDINIEWWTGETLAALLNATGIPQTFPTTARHLSALSKVVIGPKHALMVDFDTYQLRYAAIEEASRISEQIVLEFKVRIAGLYEKY